MAKGEVAPAASAGGGPGPHAVSAASAADAYKKWLANPGDPKAYEDYCNLYYSSYGLTGQNNSADGKAIGERASAQLPSF